MNESPLLVVHKDTAAAWDLRPRDEQWKTELQPGTLLRLHNENLLRMGLFAAGDKAGRGM